MRLFLPMALIALTATTAKAMPGESRRVVTQRALDTALGGAQRTACISCHVTGQVMAAVGAAEVSGFPANEGQANRVLGFAWSQQRNGAIWHDRTSYPIEASAWVAWALSYYSQESVYDLRPDAITRLGDYLLSIRQGDGGLPQNDHDNGIISIPSRVMPTMSAARISNWLFNQTGEMRFRSGMADLGRFLGSREVRSWHGDDGLLETCYEIIGMAAAGRSARDPRLAALRDNLLARQRDNRCWGFSRGASCDAFSTGLVGNALLDAGVPFGHPSLQNAVRWLIDSNDRSGWWPRRLFSSNESVSTNPVILLSRIPVFYVSHLTPNNGATFADGTPNVTITTDGISEEGFEYELTLFIDNIPVARSRSTGIEHSWDLRHVTPGQHRLRVVGIDSEGNVDSRESVVLVGDFVGMLGEVTPNPFNPDQLASLIEYEVFGAETGDVTVTVHATKDDERGVPTRAGIICSEENAAQRCVSEGSQCLPSEGEEGISRCSNDTVLRTLVDGAIQPGANVVRFDGNDADGQRLPDGVYLIHFSAVRGEAADTDSVLVGLLSDPPAEIRGVVKDRDTDRGIPGARVVLQTPRGGRMQAGEVGMSGNYVLPLIRPGDYRVVAEVPGYPEPGPVPTELAPAERARIDFWLTGNQPPFFVPVDPVAPQAEGQTLVLNVQAHDMQNDPIRLSATPPRGGRFEDLGEGRGRLTWTVPFGIEGDAALILEASDGRGVTELLVPLPVRQTNRPPTLHGLADASLRQGDTLERRIHASDPDGDDVELTVRRLPPGASFDGDTLRYTAPAGTVARFDVEVIGEDYGEPRLRVAEVLSIAVGPPNSPPELRRVESIDVPTGLPFSHRFAASDPDGDRLSFSAEGLPEGLTMDENGLLQGEVADDLADQSIEILVHVDDNNVPRARDSMMVKLRFVAPNNEPFVNLPERIDVVPGSVWRHRVDFGAPGGREHLRLMVLAGPLGLDLLPDGETLRWEVPADFEGQTGLMVGLRAEGQLLRARAVLFAQAGNLAPKIVINGTPAFDGNGQAKIDATASFDPEGLPLTFSWNGEAGLSVADNGDGLATVTSDGSPARRVVLTVSDGEHQTSQTIVIAPPPAAVPDSCQSSGGASLWLVLLSLLVLGLRGRMAAALMLLVAVGGCHWNIDIPRNEATGPSGLVPGLLSVDAPDSEGIVKITGAVGAASPEALVAATGGDETGQTTAAPNGAFSIKLPAEGGSTIELTQTVDGETSAPVAVTVPHAAPTGLAWIESDGRGGEELVVHLRTAGEATGRIKLGGQWTDLPAADADGRVALPLETGIRQAGDPIIVAQEIDGLSSKDGQIMVMEAASTTGVSVTPSDTDDGTLWVGGPPRAGREGARVLVTNLDHPSLVQARAEADDRGAFGAVALPGRHGDRLRIETIGELEDSSDDTGAPINALRLRQRWQRGGTLQLSGSPGASKAGTSLRLEIPERRATSVVTADENGGFNTAVIASPGETILISQDCGGGVWSTPVRVAVQGSGFAYDRDALRTAWGDDGLTVTGLGSEGATGVSIGLMPRGSSTLPSDDSVQQSTDESGGFSATVADASPGDQLVVRVDLGGGYSEPVFVTVPEQGGQSLVAGETTVQVAPCPCGDPNWKLVALPPGSATPGASLRFGAGEATAEGSVAGTTGSASAARGSASSWTMEVGSDGGSGQRLVKLGAGTALSVVVDGNEQRAICGVEAELIAVIGPNVAGDLTVLGAPGAAAAQATVGVEVGGGRVQGTSGADGSFSVGIPGNAGDTITITIELPGCGCSSAPLIITAPGEGDAELADIDRQKLQVWRRPGGIILRGAAGAAPSGSRLLAAVAGGGAAQTLVADDGSFQLPTAGQPGAIVELRARRGSARSAAVTLCAPDVAGLFGLTATACGRGVQFSGRPGTGTVEQVLTWTRTDIDPPRGLAQRIGANQAALITDWQVPSEARLSITLAPPQALLGSDYGLPQAHASLRVLGPFEGEKLLYGAGDDGLDGVAIWQGFGAQQRFLGALPSTPDGGRAMVISDLVGPINIYETHGDGPHFPYLLSTEPTAPIAAVRGDWTTQRNGAAVRFSYRGENLVADDMVLILDAELRPLAKGRAVAVAVEPGEEPSDAVELTVEANLPIGSVFWLVRINGEGSSTPIRSYAPDGDPIDEGLDHDGPRFADSLRDSDGDGIPDLADLDSDNDGISDAVEANVGEGGPVDTDEDGIPDYRDEDSDNDGISDADEVGDDPANPRDIDNDGLPDHLDDDSDGNGIGDAIERGNGDSPADFDGDGLPNYIDVDDDNDGFSDSVELGDNPEAPANLGEGAEPDFRNPCYPRAPIAHASRPIPGSELKMALPSWIDLESALPLSGDLVPAGQGCERPDLTAEPVRRPAGLRYGDAEGLTAGATLSRHLPESMDALPSGQAPIAFLERGLRLLEAAGLHHGGAGPRRLVQAGLPAATVAITLRADEPTALARASETVAATLLANCVDDGEGGQSCPNPPLLEREQAGQMASTFELTVTARLRCAGRLELQFGLSKTDGLEPGQAEIQQARSRMLGQGSLWGGRDDTMAQVCRDRNYGAAADTIDFIIVVDNSGSMAEEQAALSRAVSHLTDAMGAAGISWRAAVTTMDANPDLPGGDGQLLGDGFTSNLSTLRGLVEQAGIAGDGREYGMRALRRSLQRATAEGRVGGPRSLRADVPVSFLVLTDTEDQSVRQAGCSEADADGDGQSDDAECMRAAIAPARALLAGEVDGLEAPEGSDHLAQLFAITSHPQEGCWEAESYGWGWRELATSSGGSVGSICGDNLDYRELLRRMGEQAVNQLPELGDGQPLLESSVLINAGSLDARVEQGAPRWRLNTETHRIRLLDSARPRRGQQLGYSGLVWQAP